MLIVIEAKHHVSAAQTRSYCRVTARGVVGTASAPVGGKTQQCTAGAGESSGLGHTLRGVLEAVQWFQNDFVFLAAFPLDVCVASQVPWAGPIVVRTCSNTIVQPVSPDCSYSNPLYCRLVLAVDVTRSLCTASSNGRFSYSEAMIQARGHVTCIRQVCKVADRPSYHQSIYECNGTSDTQ